MKLSNDEIKFLQNKQELIENPEKLLSLLETAVACGVDEYSAEDNASYNTLIIGTETLKNGLFCKEKIQQKKNASKQIEAINEGITAVINEIYDASILAVFLQGPMDGQRWYVNRMKANGYDLSTKGFCNGLSHMAMQAFLANDMKTFEDRLITIASTPLDHFRSDFAHLRKTQQRVFQEGKLDAAKKMMEDIINMHALFDGIALYQHTEKYKHLFEEPDRVFLQDTAKTMQLILPLSLSSEDNVPVLIKRYSGAYNRDELAQYLTMLEQLVSENSFALILHSNKHVVNLNYDSNAKHWIFIDPNRLPEKVYTDTSQLADALLLSYEQKNGLVLETNFYTTNKQAKNVENNFVSMQATQTWLNLHDPSRLKTVYEDGITQFEYAINRDDAQWIQSNIKFGLDLNQPKKNATPLMQASYVGSLNVVDLFIEHQVDMNYQNINGETALIYAAKAGRSTVVKKLINSSADVNLEDNTGKTALHWACVEGDATTIQFLLDASLKPTEQMLLSACVTGQTDVVSTLINHGMKPTHEMLIVASLNGNAKLMDILHGASSKNNLPSQAYEDVAPKKMSDFKKALQEGRNEGQSTNSSISKK